MASPAPRQPSSSSGPVAPPAEPDAIRACLPPEVAAVFDREWEFVLEQAKASRDSDGVHELLQAWRFHAHAELTEPGSYFRVQDAAARAQATGRPAPGSVSAQEIQALIQARLA